MYSVLVTNTSPEYDESISGDELLLFRQTLASPNAYPFTHQSRAFQLIRDGKECVLVAGTAAGKTLAVVIPLLLGVKNGRSQKVLFLYPALALLEDQLGTIRKVAEFLDLEEEVGYIYGGMTRQELIKQLNKNIIVATPDAVYWFLEKNVKFSPVLFYSLCHVDDIVLDEAHLLSGLMGYNLKSFLDRISEIRQRFLQKESFRTHVLTATPSEVVAQLSQGETIFGRSKVGAVQFEFEPPIQGEKWGNILHQEVNRGFNRMLLVLNAASRAHREYHDNTVDADHATLNAFKPHFGYAPLGSVVRELLECGVEPVHIERWAALQLENEKVPFQTLAQDQMVTLQQESVVERSGKITQDAQLLQQWEEHVADRFQEQSTWTATASDWRGWFKQLRDASPFSRVGSELLTSKIPATQIQWSVQELTKIQEPRVYLKVFQEDRRFNFPHEQVIRNLIESGVVQLCYIKLLKGTKIPVFLYTGSMPKPARRGLIQAFQASDAPQAILISTSAVEVGVDFDVDLLVTEACTGNSFLQRFGRVGRRGGERQRVRLITGDGSITGRLQKAFGQADSCTREEFSNQIQSIMKQRKYFSSSPYLQLMHQFVTRRLGEVGRLLEPERDPLEQTILEAGGFRYGLRSTMPQVELLDEGIGRDPFQILASVPQEKLHAVSSPFTVAKADMYFEEWIYQARDGEVLIEQEKTLRSMKLLFYFSEGKLQSVDPTILFGISTKTSFDYWKTGHYRLNDTHGVDSVLSSSNPAAKTIQQYAKAVRENPLLNRYILGLGDVYLTKVHAGGGTLIKDNSGTPIVLRNQMILIQPKLDERKEEFQTEVTKWYEYEQEILVNSYQDNGAANLGKGQYAIGHAALDRVAGACVELYRELVQA